MQEIFIERPLKFGWTLCQYWPAEIILKHPRRKRGIYIKAPWYRWADRERHEAKDGSFPLEKTLPHQQFGKFSHFFLQEWEGARVYQRHFGYVTRYGRPQAATLTARRSRTRSVLWALRWFPWAGEDYDTLSIEFSEEMGSERGSWKGGVVGTSLAMRKGETVAEALDRFLAEAQATYRWDR